MKFINLTPNRTGSLSEKFTEALDRTQKEKAVVEWFL